MATQGKVEADAKRMGSRGFGGYIFDRATGSHDFRADPGAEKPSGASDRPLETRTTRRKGVTDDAYKAGGPVKPKLTMKTYEQSGLDKDPKGSVEGSPADLKRDRAAIATENRKRGYATGGVVITTNAMDAAGGPAKTKRGYGKARGA